MSTKVRKQGSWLIIIMMVGIVAGFGTWATHERQHSAQMRYERDEQARRAELIILSNPKAIIMCNRRGEMILFNPAAEKLFGYDASEVAGSSIDLLIPDGLRYKHDEMFKAAIERIESVPPKRYVLYRQDIHSVGQAKGGGDVPLVLALRVIKYDGEIEFIAIISPEGAEDPVEGPGQSLPELSMR